MLPKRNRVAFDPCRLIASLAASVSLIAAAAVGEARGQSMQDAQMAMQQLVAIESMLDKKLQYAPDQVWAAPLRRRLQGCRGRDDLARANCIGDVVASWIGHECGIAPDLRLTESRIRVVARQMQLPVDMVRGMANDPLVNRLFAMSAVLWTDGCERTGGDGAGRSPDSGAATPEPLSEPSESLRRLMEEHERDRQRREDPLTGPPRPRGPDRTLEDELSDPVGARPANDPCLAAEHIRDNRTAVKAVILCLWGNHPAFGPSIQKHINGVTPQLGEYVMRVFVCHTAAHRFLRLFGEAAAHPRPWSTWVGVARWVADMVRAYASEDQDWGLAIRATASVHGRIVRDHLMNGLEFAPSFDCGRIGRR